jgi:opacity protein-like surface antigen
MKLTGRIARETHDQPRRRREMKRTNSLTHRAVFAAVLLLAAITFTAAIPGTASASEGDEWQFGLNLYLWYGDIGGGTVNGADIDVEADDILDKLEMGFMGGVNARRGKWGGLVDVLYLKVGDENSVTGTLPTGAGVNLGADLEVKTWVVTPAVTYRVVENERVSLDVLAGARYLSMEADLELMPAAVQPFSRTFNRSDEVWDAIIGVRGELALAEKWFVPYHLDIGTGETDFTWQAMGGIGYRFSKVDIVVAYRYLSWDFEDDAKVFDDLNLSGPLAGVRIRF